MVEENKRFIKAVEETANVAISRQAAKKALEDRFMELQKRHSADRYETNFCLNAILELPPVTPQPKTGYWIHYDGIKGRDNVEKCSRCNHPWLNAALFDIDTKEFLRMRFNYCPTCGTEMIGYKEE